MSARLHDRGPICGKRSNVHPKKCVGVPLKECKKLTDGTPHQYIELNNDSTGGLPYSAKFRYGHLFWKLHGEECLVTIGSSYVAQVSIEKTVELENASDLGSARTTLMKRLQIKKVLLDRIRQQTENFANSIQALLEEIGEDCATQSESAKCLQELMTIAEKHSYKIGFGFSKDLRTSKLVHSTRLKVAFVMYAAARNILRNRSNFQREAKWFIDWEKNNAFLRELFNRLFDQHKDRLLEGCSPQIKSILGTLDPRRCLLIRAVDIKLFSDLECTLNDTMFNIVLPEVVNNFTKRVAALKLEELCHSMPVANDIYFYVCKSLMEILTQVATIDDRKDSIHYADDKWTMALPVERQNGSPVARCLLRQLQFLVEIANHFEPGKATAKVNYPYTFQINLFENAKSANSEQHLWLCLMDATIIEIFQGDISRFEEFSGMLKMFHKCLTSEHSKVESQESFRMLTHNALEFVAQTEQASFGCNEMNKEILMMQISCMDQSLFEGKASFTRYRDAMDVFKEHRIYCNNVLPQLPRKLRGSHFKYEVVELQNKLMDIAFQALQKKVPLEDTTKFFRAYNELLIGLKDLSLEWYVRIVNNAIKNGLLERKEIECVQNRLKDTGNECYLVLEYDSFVQVCEAEGVPEHYQMSILSSFLEHIGDLLQKHRWTRGTTMLTEKDQLSVTILLINAIRSSLRYLQEQPEYINFDKYSEESIQPFRSVIEESDSMENFSKRVAQIKKSFWYIRNQRAIGIDEALKFFKQDNQNFNEGILKTSFKIYNDQFEKYMREYGEMDDVDKIDRIVKDTWGKVRQNQCSEWTSDFKRNTVPTILAGLGAVWSVLVSQDVASSGNYLKPHSIQVLSILRLLSVDNYSTGVDKHLAQILTGQGKSVVLGLMAAVLALLGHTVVIVCYSKYLVKRDSDDFRVLFQKFSIDAEISYKTFEAMTYELIEPLSELAKDSMSKRVGIPNPAKKNVQPAKNLSNAVLLIDEVDVFFMDTFYGSTSDLGFFPSITGLGMVQHKIWDLVRNGIKDIEVEVHTFIQSSDHPDVQQLKSLMERQETFKIIDKDVEASDTSYTTQSLFVTHFRRMIETAKDIHERSVDDEWIAEFKLDDKGVITFKDELGEYRVNYYNEYNNIFIYFKLRGENFVQNVNGFDNFGYLNLHLASFSFAKMPESYSLILGVTGTLTGLNAFEKDAIEKHYKILRQSIMPSFFGTSNLKFDRNSNFKCLSDETSWRNTIFTKLNEIVDAQRSVIVFFHDVTAMAGFKKEFESKLDRLNELTINTDGDTRERCIAEAGVARTVTLATVEMGRGVDYKSSSSVEKNGGVHVIQTFFLLDAKEETQLKGRTARKDNHGSYELIVCRPHLKELKLITDEFEDATIEYNYLDESRKRLAADVGQNKTKDLEKANALHEMSVAFCMGCAV